MERWDGASGPLLEVVERREGLTSGPLAGLSRSGDLKAMNRSPRYPLTPLERWAMHDTHKGVCWVCGNFVELRGMEADHIIPKSRRNKAGQIDLPPNFDFDALENLLPSHAHCNKLKSNKENTYLHVLALGNAKTTAALIREKVAKLQASTQVAGVLARIEQHIESDQLKPDDLEVIRRALRQADEPVLFTKRRR